MQQITTTVTQRGQVALPAEVRRLLGVKPRDNVTFAKDDEGVRLLPAPFTLESAYGSVQPLMQPEDFDARIQAAKEERAEKALRKRIEP